VSRELKDPFAIHFSKGRAAMLLEPFQRESRVTDAIRRVLRRVSLGLIDHNTVRMVLIDGLLRSWVASGCRQVVLVGAGMDSRGWRMAELSEATVFELDRGPTQALKRARSERLPTRCQSVRFVTADFERDGLSEVLTEQGFRLDQPAAWVCEGVTPYLRVEAIARLVATVAELSAPGSMLALSYITPRPAKVGGRGLAERLATRLGEPPRGIIAKADVHQHLREAGFSCVEDLDWLDWIARVPGYRPVSNVFKERLVVAERRP
jgi:methyltransferase (TIGR00027 family)